MLGDFNAHLGERNMQGLLLQELLERCELSVVSQGAMASGPAYTFCNGDVKTTVDYILMDIEAASMMTSCFTHCMEDLNTSDHLPITVFMAYDACLDNCSGSNPSGFNWIESKKSGALAVFATEIQRKLEPFINRVYDNAEMISREIEQIATILHDTAVSLLPCVQLRRRSKWRDDVLSSLCAQSRQARVG